MSSKMDITKKSVQNLHRRGSTLFALSVSRKPRIDFGALDDGSSVGGTGTTATESWPSGENQAAMRRDTSSGSAAGAGGAGDSKNEASAGRIGLLLSAIPLSKLKIVIGVCIHE